MNYAEMPAGPELDRLLAEKVMGWRARDNRLSGGYLFGWAKPDGSWGACAISGSNAWSPSTDIAHAFEVVEKLRQSRTSIGITWTAGRLGMCQVSLERATMCEPIRNTANADTVPLAICRAALMALKPESE